MYFTLFFLWFFFQTFENTHLNKSVSADKVCWKLALNFCGDSHLLFYLFVEIKSDFDLFYFWLQYEIGSNGSRRCVRSSIISRYTQHLMILLLWWFSYSYNLLNWNKRFILIFQWIYIWIERESEQKSVICLNLCRINILQLSKF